MNIIKVINSCKQVIENNNNFTTTKKSIENHGLGIGIMKQQVSKYNGDLILKFNDKVNKFTTTVILPYKK